MKTKAIKTIKIKVSFILSEIAFEDVIIQQHKQSHTKLKQN